MSRQAKFEILLRRVVDRWNAQLAMTRVGTLKKIEIGEEMQPQNAWLRWPIHTYVQLPGERLIYRETQAIVRWGPPDEHDVIPVHPLIGLLLEKLLSDALAREREAERDPLKKAMQELDRLLPKADDGLRRLPETRQEKLLALVVYDLQPSRQKERWIRKQFGCAKENPKLSPSTLRSWKRLL